MWIKLIIPCNGIVLSNNHLLFKFLKYFFKYTQSKIVFKNLLFLYLIESVFNVFEAVFWTFEGIKQNQDIPRLPLSDRQLYRKVT